MRICFLSNWFPYPPLNGAKIRIYNLIRELAAQHEVGLFAFCRTFTLEEAQGNIPHLRNYCDPIQVIPARSFSRNNHSENFKRFFSRLPRSVAATYSHEMEVAVMHELSKRPYDVIIASEVGPPSCVSLTASRIREVPVILDALEIGVIKEEFQNERRSLPRIRRWLTWRKLQGFASRLLRSAAATTVPSVLELQNLRKIAGPESIIEVVPHSLDLALYHASNEPPVPNTMVFAGSLTYLPNADAVSYLLGDILPALRKVRPQIKCSIAGDIGNFDISGIDSNGDVRFTGLLKDVRPLVGRSWVSVVPLRIGAGTRLKIIESMALGTPVVSTSKGAEGLEVRHGENILIADTSEEFAKAIHEVMGNPGLHRKLSENGRNLVAQKYSSGSVGRQLHSLLSRVTSIQKTPGTEIGL